MPGTTSGLNNMGSLLNEKDNNVISTQRRYLGRDQDSSCGPDGPLVAALLSPHLVSRRVMWAQGRGRVPQARPLRRTPLFASLSAHLYTYGGENAKEGGGVTLEAETQSREQMRTGVCHRGRWVQ